MSMMETDRRELVLGPAIGLVASALGIGASRAAGVDPAMTMVTRPGEIPWKPLYNFPPGAAETAAMFGAIGEPGQYFTSSAGAQAT